MKPVSAAMVCIAFAGIVECNAQKVVDAKNEHATLDGYFAALTSRNNAYFYGLYVNNYLASLSAADSMTIKNFFSLANQSSGQRCIQIAQITDLAQLDHLKDTVLVYGPRKMRPLVRDYVPSPRIDHADGKRLTLFKWFGNTFANSVGFSASRVAYGRWRVPYSMRSVECNPNALPYYMTSTNTNKYLWSVEK